MSFILWTYSSNCDDVDHVKNFDDDDDNDDKYWPIMIFGVGRSGYRPDPGVRSPKSAFTGLSNYQWILMIFYGELGRSLETN